MRVAAIDIGTNSVLLLIAETKNGELCPLVERATITRLGEGVDRTRELAPAACARTLACLAEYAKDLAEYAPERSVAVGTSAMRDARGGPEFAREAERILGTLPLVIDGRREAELTFRGALSGLNLSGAGAGAGAPATHATVAHATTRVAVFDVGGGSTEIVVGHATSWTTSPNIESATSLDIGSVRLFERHVRTDPPASAELDAIKNAVDDVLRSQAAVPSDATLVGVAGTVTTLAAVAAAIDPYDPARVHGARLDVGTVTELGARLSRLSLAERKKLRGLDARRADVIVAGAVLVERFLAWTKKSDFVVSDRGVRWGLAEELAAPRTQE